MYRKSGCICDYDVHADYGYRGYASDALDESSVYAAADFYRFSNAVCGSAYGGMEQQVKDDGGLYGLLSDGDSSRRCE